MQNPEERPAYVTFEYRSIEDRNETIKQGHYCGKDVAFVSITRPGSRDTHERNAEEWLLQLESDARNGRIPTAWLEGYRALYTAWKKGEELPPTGTPIKTWPAISPAQQKTIIAAGVLTIEDLAALPDPELGRLGTGATSLKLRAREWLEAAKGSGKQAEEVAALKVKVDELTTLCEGLIEKNKLLVAEKEAHDNRPIPGPGLLRQDDAPRPNRTGRGN